MFLTRAQFWFGIFLGTVCGGLLLANTARAAGPLQGIVPDNRLAITRNMDFPGNDLQPIFQTTLENCAQTCLDDSACKAFTYNLKSLACFPKSGVSEAKPFDRAISARVFRTSPRVLKQQKARLQRLSFLPASFFAEARRQAEGLAKKHPADEWSVDQLERASRNALATKRLRDAMAFMAESVTLSDSPSGWLKFALLAFKVPPQNGADRGTLIRTASAAAINAFVRARTARVKADALRVLAGVLERRDRGRLSIDALRLAQAIRPQAETAKALDRALRLFGFRVTEHTVDNNAAQPRICVTFSEALVPAGVDYGTYVRLPEPGLAVESKGRQICVEGVRHGARYRLTFRKGLPAQSGEKLLKSVDLSVYVRDRAPSAHFVGRAYVLPRGEAARIPIVTVNLDKVDLTIRRVGERNLVRVLRNGMFANPLSSWDERDLKKSLGAEVWSGVGLVSRELNKDVTTALPIGDAVKTFKPGVYVLSARVPGDKSQDNAAASQWFVVTDLGISTMKGADGLHVFVRSLDTVAPKQGARVRLVAINNMVLAETTTDAAGYARFAPGLLRGAAASSPALVTVEKGDDFAFLGLTSPAFDLSDRGVRGRRSPPPIDVFLTTDRGAYRAGETVHATALVRDARAEALSGLALTAIVTRPDGVEFTRILSADQGAGGHVFAVPLPPTAERGTWTMRLYADPKAKALVTAKFLVEDFTPERVDFKLALRGAALKVTDVPVLDLAARYLYGAPAANLAVEAETRVSLADGLDGYPGYSFGPQDQPFAARVSFTNGKLRTDASGKLAFALTMPKVGKVMRPLKLRALVRVREGSGRPVERRIERALAPATTLLGIKPLFDGVLPQGGLAAFDVRAVGPDLRPRAVSQLRWSLVRVKTRYQWYESYGNWSYEPITTRTRIASGELTLGTAAPGHVEAPVDWGRYELRLASASAPYSSASFAFTAGWYASAGSGNTPDTLDIGLDKPRYKIGDVAHVRLVPRYAGTALVTVVSNRLIAMKTVAVKKGENMISLPVTEDWGSGAYVSATVIRPLDVAAGHNPSRAIGLNWASVDPGQHRLQVAFTTADTVRPRGILPAALKVSGLRAGETAYASIAAVDLGILNLTNFAAPDPDGHYFGQAKLGMDIRDVYGRLIDGLQGRRGQVRSGGGSPVSEHLQSAPPVGKLVSFFSGPLKVAADGTVRADFDLPAFNGTVRLMAVVWSKTGVGQASKDVLARDPVVLTASLPHFLAPHDTSRVLLEISHAFGPTGRMGLTITGSDGLGLDVGALPASFDLAAKQTRRFSLPLTAPGAEGAAKITVVLTTPDGQKLTKVLTVPVRANDPKVSRTTRIELARGKTFTLTADAFDGYRPGSGRATLSVGPIARFDAAGLLEALDRYPYGCTEQLTSKALPLLYFGDVAEALDLGPHKAVRTRIKQAIAEILSNQSSAGSFGLWAPGNGDLWLDSYVSDFLSRARSKGYSVPPVAFRLAMDNLRNQLNYAQDFEKGGEGIAYALMVLAREGAANIGDLRYYADAKADQFATPLALAQLGAALAYYGDQPRADRMFRKAGQRLKAQSSVPESAAWRVDFGTDLRDTAAVLTLAAEAGSEVLDQQALAARLSPDALVSRRRSTQENMWSLLAADALIKAAPAGAFLLNGAPVSGPLVQVLDAETEAGQRVQITNASGKSAVAMLTTTGIPLQAEPASGNGYRIERQYYTMDGQPVSVGTVPLNRRMVVVLTVSPSRVSKARLIVNDPLPAGFRIDNPHLLRSGDVKALSWLKAAAQTRHTEFRDDRFVAAVDWSGKKPLQLAYIVRATAPGRFHHPAASVEDMYRPQFHARTASDVVLIRP